jgi:precorrin-3B synthase
MPATGTRSSDHDACPGALRLHAAADGPLARVRVPGGLLTGAQLTALREISARWGDGHVELTSRANLQLRALTGAPPGELAAALHEAGLLPSESHEVVRNILASPVPAEPDVRPLVRALDQALCADPRLAELPGRFLFAIDSGAGDVTTAADVCATGTTISFGRPTLRTSDVVAGLIAAAHAFLDERQAQGTTAWRVRELQDGPARVAARTAQALDVRVSPGSAPARAHPVPPIGLTPQPDGRFAAGALVPLGRLTPAQLTVLSTVGDLVVTPWRGLLLTDLDRPAAESWLITLAAAGLEVTRESRWTGVTACAGRPGCAKSLADIRADAWAATRPGTGLPVHWIGCARGCGSPAGAHVRVEATGTGYAVTSPGYDQRGDIVEVADLVTAARRK